MSSAVMPDHGQGIDLDKESKDDVKNLFDKVMSTILVDSRYENDEPLRILKKPPFDSSREIERLDVDDSIILRLMYLKEQ